MQVDEGLLGDCIGFGLVVEGLFGEVVGFGCGEILAEGLAFEIVDGLEELKHWGLTFV